MAKLILAELAATLFPTKWKEQMVNLYAEGGCDVEARAMIAAWRGGSFNQDTWERWLKEEPEFAELIDYCRQICHAWWLKKGRSNLGNQNFNARLYALQMNNRFGWSDARHDVTDKLSGLLEAINGNTRDLPVKPSAGAAEPDAGQPGVAA
jgi:hypothetical protein